MKSVALSIIPKGGNTGSEISQLVFISTNLKIVELSGGSGLSGGIWQHLQLKAGSLSV